MTRYSLDSSGRYGLDASGRYGVPLRIIIDNFDDGLDSGWSGDTTEFSADTTTVFEGDGSTITSTTNSQLDIYSTTGLNAYFAKGEILRLYSLAQNIGTGGPMHQPWFGYADSQNYYFFELDYATGDIRLVKVEPDGAGGTTATELASTAGAFSPTSGTWYEFQVTWDDGTLGGLDNDITVDYNDASAGTNLATLSANDSTHATNDGVGHRFRSLGDGDINVDYEHKPS